MIIRELFLLWKISIGIIRIMEISLVSYSVTMLFFVVKIITIRINKIPIAAKMAYKISLN
jgi:hypothetical protein